MASLNHLEAKEEMKQNFVAKHMNTFNKAAVQVDKKRKQKHGRDKRAHLKEQY